MKSVAAADELPQSGFQATLSAFLRDYVDSKNVYKIGVRVYAEQVFVLSLRQDPSQIGKSRTLVCQTLAFLKEVEVQGLQPLLNREATQQLG